MLRKGHAKRDILRGGPLKAGKCAKRVSIPWGNWVIRIFSHFCCRPGFGIRGAQIAYQIGALVGRKYQKKGTRNGAS